MLTSPDGECYQSSGYDDATMGTLTADGITWIGAFVPRVRSSAWLTVQLAADELSSSGLFAAAPLLVVACSDSVDKVPAAIRHVDGLGIDAILAPSDGVSVASLASATPPSPGRLLLSPAGYLPKPASDTRSDDVVRYMGPTYLDVVPAYASVIDALVTRLQNESSEVRRIASVVSAAEEDVRIEGLVRETIRVNGQGPVRLENEDTLHVFVLGELPRERVEALERISVYDPDIILWFAGGAFGDAAHEERASAVRELEELASTRADWAPIYVFGPRNTEDATLRALASQDAGFRARALGVRADRAVDAAAGAALFGRFSGAYPRAASTRLVLNAMPSVYEAFYNLAYGLAVARRTGASLRQSFEELASESTETVPIGPSGFERTGSLLSSATPFGLAGLSGLLRFDADYPSRSATVRTFCWAPSAQLEDSAAYQPTQGLRSYFPVACEGGALDESP